MDTYSEEILIKRYDILKLYITETIKIKNDHKIKIRLPHIDEDISENIIKFIIRNKLNDFSCKWGNKIGDLYSEKEGKQECKCFTSNGPLSFTPKTVWNVIYFLDAREWLNDNFKLYKINLSNKSEEWMNIKINQKQNFNDQCLQGRRPRLSWNEIEKQLKTHISLVYEGTFDEIFIRDMSPIIVD